MTSTQGIGSSSSGLKPTASHASIAADAPTHSAVQPKIAQPNTRRTMKATGPSCLPVVPPSARPSVGRGGFADTNNQYSRLVNDW